MKRLTLLLALLALAACGDDLEKGPNSSTNGSTNSTTANVGTNVVANNSDCNFRLCPGQDLGDGWTVMDYHLGYFYQAMWIEAPDEIWLATQDGRVRRGSGTTWEEFPVEGAEQLIDIEGDGNGNVWVTAYPGAIYRFDNGTWVPETIVDDPGPDRGLSELAHDPVTGEMFANSQWFGVWKRVGEQWEFVTRSSGLMHNVANCNGRQWIATSNRVLTVDGDRPVVWGLPESNEIAEAITLPTGEWIGAGDEVTYYDGDYKMIPRGAEPVSLQLSGIAGTSLDDLWGFYNGNGESFVYRHDGSDWVEVATYDRQNRIEALYTDTPGQVRVVFEKSSSVVLDEQGNESNRAGLAPGALTLSEEYPVHFFSMNDYVAKGYRWTPETDWEAIIGLSSSGGLSVWAANEDDIWVLGERGSLSRWQAGDQRSIRPDFDIADNMTIVRGSETGHVWVAGYDQVIQWNGTEWIDHSDFDGGLEPPPIELGTALVAQGDQAWVWRYAQLFHWDGSSWTHVQPDPRVSRLGCDNDSLVGIATQPPALLRGGPTGWSIETDITDENVSASSAWMSDANDAWFITQDFPAVRYWNGAEWQPSLENPGQLRQIQEWGNGTVYLLATDAVIVRE